MIVIQNNIVYVCIILYKKSLSSRIWLGLFVLTHLAREWSWKLIEKRKRFCSSLKMMRPRDLFKTRGRRRGASSVWHWRWRWCIRGRRRSSANNVIVDMGVFHADLVNDIQQVLGIHGQDMGRRQHAPRKKGIIQLINIATIWNLILLTFGILLQR